MGKLTEVEPSSAAIPSGLQLVHLAAGRLDDVIGVGRAGEDNHLYPIVYLDSNREVPFTWLSEDLGEDAYQAKLLVNENTVYFVIKPAWLPSPFGWRQAMGDIAE